MSDGLTLPELTVAQAAWASRVLGLSRRIEFTIGTAGWVVKVVPPTGAPVAPIVRLLAGENSLWVGMSDWDALLSGSPMAAGVTLADLPPDIGVAVIEAAAEPVLEAISRATGLAWTVIEVAPGNHPPHPWQVGLQLAGPEGAFLEGQISAAPADLTFIETLIARCPIVPAPQAPVPPFVAAVEIGMTSLPVGELKTLRPRDVLLMDVTAFVPDRHAIVRISKTAAWRVTVGEGQATLVEPRTTTAPTALPLDSPSVNVVIGYGDVVIPAASLRGLAPGQSLPIGNAGRIQLSIEGRPFATGELIEVGLKLGVRLLELGSPPR